MFPLKLVHSLVSGDNFTQNPLLLNQNHHFINHDNNLDEADDNNRRIPLLLFIPTQEIVQDTYRLASIARTMGMDLHPNPSLSHIIFSWPSPSSSSGSSSSSWSLPNGAVPLPFPSFATASLSHLRLFANLTKGYFKLAFLKNNCSPLRKIESLSNNNWHCTSLSLFFTRTGERIDSMDGFSKALLGTGWTLLKLSRDFRKREVYLYRKLDVSKICNTNQLKSENSDSTECSRVRELRLPPLDFRNAPLRILQYILLMTDDIFCLA